MKNEICECKDKKDNHEEIINDGYIDYGKCYLCDCTFYIQMKPPNTESIIEGIEGNLICGACNTENIPNSKFCQQCGSASFKNKINNDPLSSILENMDGTTLSKVKNDFIFDRNDKNSIMRSINRKLAKRKLEHEHNYTDQKIIDEYGKEILNELSSKDISILRSQLINDGAKIFKPKEKVIFEAPKLENVKIHTDEDLQNEYYPWLKDLPKVEADDEMIKHFEKPPSVKREQNEWNRYEKVRENDEIKKQYKYDKKMIEFIKIENHQKQYTDIWNEETKRWERKTDINDSPTEFLDGTGKLVYEKEN